MPTYEYHCQKCDQNFEMFQSIRDAPVRECPKDLCRLPKWGRGKVKRLFGTGFYSTDYRSKAYQEAAKKEAPTAAGEKSATTKESKTPKPSTSSPSTKPKKESAE